MSAVWGRFCEFCKTMAPMSPRAPGYAETETPDGWLHLPLGFMTNASIDVCPDCCDVNTIAVLRGFLASVPKIPNN